MDSLLLRIVLGVIALQIWVMTGFLAADVRRDPHWIASQKAFKSGDYQTFNAEAEAWERRPSFCPFIIICPDLHKTDGR